MVELKLFLMPTLKRSGRVKAFLGNTTRRVEIFQKSRLGLDSSLEGRFIYLHQKQLGSTVWKTLYWLLIASLFEIKLKSSVLLVENILISHCKSVTYALKYETLNSDMKLYRCYFAIGITSWFFYYRIRNGRLMKFSPNNYDNDTTLLFIAFKM